MDIIGLEIAYSALLNQSGVGKAKVVEFRPDDDVIEHTDAEYGARADETLGGLAVLTAWGRIP